MKSAFVNSYAGGDDLLFCILFPLSGLNISLCNDTSLPQLYTIIKRAALSKQQ